MSLWVIVALVVASVAILFFLLYFLSQKNIWDTSNLEEGEYEIFAEQGLELRKKNDNFLVKNIGLLITNKRLVFLRGKYKFIVVYLIPSEYSDNFGKIKKSFTTNRYNLFSDKSRIRFDKKDNKVEIDTQTYLGLQTTYEITVKDVARFMNILK